MAEPGFPKAAISCDSIRHLEPPRIIRSDREDQVQAGNETDIPDIFITVIVRNIASLLDRNLAHGDAIIHPSLCSRQTQFLQYGNLPCLNRYSNIEVFHTESSRTGILCLQDMIK